MADKLAKVGVNIAEVQENVVEVERNIRKFK